MSRKICVVTGSRAEYGLLRGVMKGISEDPGLLLQIVATGMHLSPEFGLTYQEIEDDGFQIDHKVEMLLSSDTPTGLAKAMGLGLIGFADVLPQLQPDVLLVLGDRFEILAAVQAAMVCRIPIAHLHGGEATEGVIDEAIRHAITKMSHFHFVACDEYRTRVIQLGEEPSRVFRVGGLGVDAIAHTQLLDRKALEASLGFEFGAKNLLVTFHPVSLEQASSRQQMQELLTALDGLDNTNLLFTMPNADTDGRVIIRMIQQYVESRPHAKAYTSIGQQLYLSCLQYVDGVIGNSSSGLTEVPSFHKGSINIGDRQRGRQKAESVIDCAPEQDSITVALGRLYSDQFQEVVRKTRNPYGDGGASERIVALIKGVSLEGVLKKHFYDMNQP